LKKSEVAKLVVYAASVQGREATDLQVEAWAPLLVDVPLEDGWERVRAHFENQSRELWPADVRRPLPTEFPGEEWVDFR
jgi:hypothetical protein